MRQQSSAATFRLTFLLCWIVCNTEASAGWQNPETVDPWARIQLVDPFEFHKLEPKSLLVKFDATKLSGRLTFSLMGYSERNATKISKLHLPFTMLSTKVLADLNTTELDILQLDLKCSGKEDECNLYEMGFMQISGEAVAERSHPLSLMSPIVPLGWFINPSFKKADFSSWSFGKCRTWFASEPAELSAAMANVSCPTDLASAKNDPGWFLHANYLAGFSQVSGAAAPEPKQQCFYSAIEDVPPNMHAAPASLCCYRTSDSGLLQKEFSSPEKPRLHGSSVLRSHPFGSDYHKEHFLPGHVPYLSHWYWDIMPYLYCCVWWSGNACVNFYLKLRPVPQMMKKPAGSMAGYVYGSSVQSIGAPAPPAAFCSLPGEFWLIRNAAIEVQIRYYVVSEYTGPKLQPNAANRQAAYSDFRPAASRSVLVTALAVRSMELPDKVVEIVCPEGEFRSYVQVTDRKDGRTADYELKAGRGIGTKVIVSDSTVEDGNRVFSILARHSTGRVGITAYAVHPGEEFLNLYVTISGSLAQSPSFGSLLIEGVHCGVYRVQSPSERLFSSLCDSCDDFDKYQLGRPLYFEELAGPDPNLIPAAPDPSCGADITCHYMVWSTNYPPYFVSSSKAKKEHIDKLITEVGYTGTDVCQKPDISALSVIETQSFNASAVIRLICLKPFTASAQNVIVTCKNTGNGLAFDYPKDFICAESTEVAVLEQKAAAADAEYTKEHYTPEASKKLATFDKRIPGLSETLLSILGVRMLLGVFFKLA